MHNLFGNKIGFVIVMCLFSLVLNGQFDRKQNRNFLDFQQKPYYFGITLGLNNSSFKINPSSDFINNDSIRIVESEPGVGFNLYGIINVKFGEYFDFRVTPGFSFAERQIAYTSTVRDEVERRKIESVFFDIPMLVRFKSAPYKDKRVFVVGGLKYSYDIASNSKTRQAENLVKISPHDYQLEIGVGMQFFFPYFILSPEIKFSRGITNSLIYNDALNQARILEDVHSQIFTISFHFEG